MFLYLLVIVLGIWLDQLTKWLAVTFLRGGESFVLIPGALQLTYVENRGAAFGILQDKRWVFLVVSTVAIAALFVLFVRKYKTLHPLLRWGLALVISGGIGNMIDRLLMGYVVDFVDVVLIRFAVFNAADSFVTVGAALFFCWALFIDLPASRGKEKKKQDAAPEGPEDPI